MTLPAGARLGPYEVLAHVGSGGMGEVYRARDTRLDRIVAIKVLPPHVLDDPGSRARFEREARVASSLDHPNICVLHDVGREGAVEYLVMQYLVGETLAQRLARGPLPIGEALRLAADLAGALDAAHRAGILHRDIKPGNVMLVKDAGRDASAKLLDFGLAKTISAGAVPAPATVATATSPLTGRGTIVGTLQYMSPEQLEGRELDARSDVFSFGAMLYEMVTGRRAFDGGSEGSIIAAILDRDPPSMASVAPLTPPALDRLVRKCLSKDRERRWQSAADLGDELSWIAQSSGVQQPPAATSRSTSRRVLWPGLAVLTVAGLSAALTWAVVANGKKVSAGLTRELAIAIPDAVRAARGGIAVSPDGRTIVFAGARASSPADSSVAGEGSVSRLYLRRFDSSTVTEIPGTEGARTPFFSPDSQSIAFFTSSGLLKLSLRGGSPVLITSVPPVTRGGVWLPDDTIAVSPTQTSPLARISMDGKSRPLTTVDTAQGERAHLWPSLLTGGEDILYAVRRGTTADVDASDIAIFHVATGEHRIVYQGGSFPQYSPTGHLLFVRAGTLWAVPLGLASRTARGTAVPIAEHVAVDSWVGGAHYSVGPDGTIVLYRGEFPQTRLAAVWVDPSGNPSPAAGVTGRAPGQPRISPDGARAVFDAPSPDGDDEVYVADLARGTAVRLSNDPEDDFNAAWTPDGRRVVWTALPPNKMPALVTRAADGSGDIEPVAPDDRSAQFMGSISRAGILAFTRGTATGARDIWVVPLEGERKARPFIASPGAEFGPEFSPDGKWIAYVSRESGVSDVYVAPYPGPGGTRRVTSAGGVSPAWSRDGHTLFYQRGADLMAVNVTGAAELQFGLPRRLFTGSFVIDSREDGPRAYDVSPDGKRFLMLMDATTAVPPPALQVLLNWVGELKR